MTSGLQPINAGAPVPVQGVTGGPGINQGTASVDPGTGALVFHPQPANVVQVRGSTPGAFQVYEYFTSNTIYSRLSLNAKTNGPFQIAVETDPSTVIRDLDILANGNIVITAGEQVTINATQVNIPEALVVTQITTGTVGAPSGATLNLSGSGTPFSVIFSIGAAQPWAFIPSGDFSPTATNAYNIGAAANRVKTVFVETVDYGLLGQGAGAAATLGLIRGAGFGPTAAAQVGWIQMQSGGAPIYVPYWQ